jgi:hypothetical protein
MLECYLAYRKNASSPLLKCFISACLELARKFRQGNDKIAQGHNLKVVALNPAPAIP